MLMECLEPPAITHARACVIAGGSDQSQNTGQLYADQCFDNMARVNSPPPFRPADVPDVWQLKGICAD